MSLTEAAVTAPALGRHRVSVLVAALVVVTLVGVRAYAPGILFGPLLADTGWSRVQVSFVVTIQTLMNGVALLAVGWLGGRLSSRAMIAATTALGAAGFVASGFVQSVWGLALGLGVLAGIGGGAVALVAAITIVSRAFTERRALAVSIVQSGISAGSIVAPALLVPAVHALGWRMAFIVVGALVGVVSLAMLPWLGPESPHGGVAPASSSEALSGQGWTVRQALGTAVYWLLYLQFFLVMASWSVVATHLYLHVTDLGFAPATAGAAIMWVGASGIVGRFALVPFVDRLGLRTLFALSFALMAVAHLVLLREASPLGVLAFGGLFGLGCGVSLPLFPIVLGRYYGVGLLNRLFAIQYSASSLAGIVAPVAAGWAFDTLGTYVPVFQAIFLASLLAAAASARLRAPALAGERARPAVAV